MFSFARTDQSEKSEKVKPKKKTHKNKDRTNNNINTAAFFAWIWAIMLAVKMTGVSGLFLGGSVGNTISSSNYMTISRVSLKNGDVTTLTPQGWLNRALKGINTGTRLPRYN
jgi:hypothetical protein